MSKESLDKKRDAIQVIKLALCVFPKYYTQFIINRFPESYANDPYAIDRIRNPRAGDPHITFMNELLWC